MDCQGYVKLVRFLILEEQEYVIYYFFFLQKKKKEYVIYFLHTINSQKSADIGIVLHLLKEIFLFRREISYRTYVFVVSYLERQVNLSATIPHDIIFTLG